jgi:hypothetical protein
MSIVQMTFCFCIICMVPNELLSLDVDTVTAVTPVDHSQSKVKCHNEAIFTERQPFYRSTVQRDILAFKSYLPHCYYRTLGNSLDRTITGKHCIGSLAHVTCPYPVGRSIRPRHLNLVNQAPVIIPVAPPADPQRLIVRSQ